MKQAFSPLRQSILDLVERSATPLSAHDIFESIGENTAFSTVYRALWYLEEQEKIEGFFLSCAECGNERYYISRSLGHAHFFHCEKCHSFINIGECFFEPVKKSLEKKFKITVKHHSFHVSGLCSSCGGKAHE